MCELSLHVLTGLCSSLIYHCNFSKQGFASCICMYDVLVPLLRMSFQPPSFSLLTAYEPGSTPGFFPLYGSL